MGKYTELTSGIFKFFSGLTWGLENIPTYPQGVTAKENDEKFIRISISPSGDGINLQSVSGICIIDIYTALTMGPMEPLSIADKLDEYLVGQDRIMDNGRLQFPISSTLAPKGQDKDNLSLVRHSYTIPFKYFGVFS
jgi:hypothetical protein